MYFLKVYGPKNRIKYRVWLNNQNEHFESSKTKKNLKFRDQNDT